MTSKRPRVGTADRRPRRIYRELDEDRARVLYTILRLQDHYPGAGATQKIIAEYTNLTVPRVNSILAELKAAGYLIESRIYGEKSARIVYEVDTGNSVTFRDTAVIIMELLQFQTDDPEGKIEIEKFISHLLRSNKLRDFNQTDLLGTERIREKIDLLADSGQHVERITARFIKPRLKARLQMIYLRLIVDEVALDVLSTPQADA